MDDGATHEGMAMGIRHPAPDGIRGDVANPSWGSTSTEQRRGAAVVENALAFALYSSAPYSTFKDRRVASLAFGDSSMEHQDGACCFLRLLAARIRRPPFAGHHHDVQNLRKAGAEPPGRQIFPILPGTIPA